MTNSVTFDTSGWVAGKVGAQGPRHDGPNVWRWPDLPPFCQGSISKALQDAAADPVFMDAWYKQHGLRAPGFSDLHPATLARFMEDCERELDALHSDHRQGFKDSTGMGAAFWRASQRGDSHSGVPPIRLYFSPDGKVMAEEVSKEIAK
jgi:hypothetical protein